METAVLRVQTYCYADQSNSQWNVTRLQRSVPWQTALLHVKSCFLTPGSKPLHQRQPASANSLNFRLHFQRSKQLKNKHGGSYSDSYVWLFYWPDLSDPLPSFWPFYMSVDVADVILVIPVLTSNPHIRSKDPRLHHQICTKTFCVSKSVIYFLPLCSAYKAVHFWNSGLME